MALCFLKGAVLPDPNGLLRGGGRLVRNIRLESAATLDRPEVRALMKAALERAKTPIDPKGVHRLIIKSVSAKQRPRRPVRGRPESPGDRHPPDERPAGRLHPDQVDA